MTSRGAEFGRVQAEPESELPEDANPGFHRGDVQLTPALPDIPDDSDCARCALLEAELEAERKRNDIMWRAIEVLVRGRTDHEPSPAAKRLAARRKGLVGSRLAQPTLFEQRNGAAPRMNSDGDVVWILPAEEPGSDHE